MESQDNNDRNMTNEIERHFLMEKSPNTTKGTMLSNYNNKLIQKYISSSQRALKANGGNCKSTNLVG
jgi:hypothetical protein